MLVVRNNNCIIIFLSKNGAPLFFETHGYNYRNFALSPPVPNYQQLTGYCSDYDWIGTSLSLYTSIKRSIQALNVAQFECRCYYIRTSIRYMTAILVKVLLKSRLPLMSQTASWGLNHSIPNVLCTIFLSGFPHLQMNSGQVRNRKGRTISFQGLDLLEFNLLQNT